MQKLFEEKLSNLAGDTVMFDAVRCILDEAKEAEIPIINKDDSDELVGQKYRAYKSAEEIINLAMDKILTFKEYKNNNNDFDKSK